MMKPPNVFDDAKGDIFSPTHDGKSPNALQMKQAIFCSRELGDEIRAGILL